MRLLTSVALLALSATAALARPGHGNSVSNVTNPCAGLLVDNGCSGANPNGSFFNPSLLVSAQQSGQTSLLSSNPWGYGIAGANYAVAPDKTLTPGDPRTAIIPGCSVTGTAPTEALACGGTTGAVNHLVVNNLDFCGTTIGKAPMVLYFGGSVLAGSDATVTNNYFCTQPPPVYATIGFFGNWNIIFKNNQVDGAAATSSSLFAFSDDGDNVGTTFLAEYNAFTHQGVGRVAGGFRNMATAWKFNFIEGLNNLITGNHGEIELRTCSGGGCHPAYETYEGNFNIWDSTTVQQVNNAPIFPSTGSSNGLKFDAINIINNIVVTNTSGNPSTPTSPHQIGQGLFGQRAASLGAVKITGNLVDATGATSCGISGTTSGGVVTASQTGNVISITVANGFGNDPLEPGWQFYRAGVLVATVLSMGTSIGSTGTVNVDTSANIPSDSAWVAVPGYSSADLTGNKNIRDGSDIGFSGPAMTATNCVGNHN